MPRPTRTKFVSPVYPDAAKQAGLIGQVVLEAVVTKAGRIAQVRVTNGVAPDLDQAAVDAVRQWEYEPLMFGTKPETWILTVTLNFKLPRPGAPAPRSIPKQSPRQVGAVPSNKAMQLTKRARRMAGPAVFIGARFAADRQCSADLGNLKVEHAAIRAFIDAAVKDQARARALLDVEPALLSARWVHGETVQHVLAVEGYAQAVRFLADAGAEIDAVNEFGDTPLLDAAVLGNAEVAAVLLEFGANPNASSAVRDNVLHAAGGSGSPEVLRVLLEAGASPHYVTELGETIWDAIARRPDDQARMEAVLAAQGIARGRPTMG